MRWRINLGRLSLEPYTDADRRDLYAIRNHPSVRKFMSNQNPIPYRPHVAWTRAHLLHADNLHLWMVRPAGHQRAIGFTQLKLSAARDTAEIGAMFKDPQKHQLSAALATAATLHITYNQLACTWLISYVIPSHQHAIDFNLAWGASIVQSDRPDMVMLKMHRDACLSNENFRRVMRRLADNLQITPVDQTGE